MKLSDLRETLRRFADPERTVGALRFFKTGPGAYGAGDQFLGVTVPQTRSLLPASDAQSEAEGGNSPETDLGILGEQATAS